MRYTGRSLYERIERLNKIYDCDLGLDSAYGGYRVGNAAGSKSYSGRGTAKEIDWFLDGVIEGIQLYQGRIKG